MSDQDEKWRDVTKVGSVWQEEISDSGGKRFRPLNLRVADAPLNARSLGQERGIGPWQYGPTPT